MYPLTMSLNVSCLEMVGRLRGCTQVHTGLSGGGQRHAKKKRTIAEKDKRELRTAESPKAKNVSRRLPEEAIWTGKTAEKAK